MSVELAFGNRRIHEVAHKLGISFGSLQSIYKDSINMYKIADKLVAHTCSLWFVCALSKKKELLFFQPIPTYQIQYCVTSFFSQNSRQHYREEYLIIITKNQAKSGHTCCITNNAPHEMLLMVA